MRLRQFHRNRILLLWILATSCLTIYGQQSNTFYLMHDVPQSNMLNPAIQIPCKWFVGIPGLSSTHLSYGNTAFTYNDLAGTDTWNLEGVFNQMHRVDLFGIEAILNPLAIGYKFRSLYFTFNIIEKVQAHQTIPRDMVEIMLHGNGPFVGETARFDAFRSAFLYSREYSLGLSKVIDHNWTVGLRTKMLFGKANINSGHSDMRFSTAENDFNLHLNGVYTLNNSLPVTLTQTNDGSIPDVSLNEINYVNFLLNRGNPGVSIDIGVLYSVDNRTTLSASLLDVGFLRWRTETNNLEGTGSFAFEGVDPGDDVVSFAFLNEMIDSLVNSYNVSLSQHPYSSYNPIQLFLGGSYQVKENISVGAVSRNVIYHSKLHSSITLSAQGNVADRFLATVSWSYLNNSIKNIGAGIAYHGKGFQFHLVSDNLVGFFFPFNTRTVNLRAGFNVMFGCPGNKQEEMQGASYGQIPRGGDCSWTGKPKNRKKLLRKASRKQTTR